MAKDKSGYIDLTIVSPEKRTFGVGSYMLMWWSSIIVIQGFVMGQSMLPPNGPLNIGQALTALVCSCLILAVFYSVNGMAGNKYGIPFALHARSSFGYNGSKVATLIRGIPAIFWTGIATWIGADAIAMVTKLIFGWGNTYLYFFIFLILQVFLVASGIETVKWFESTMAVVIVLIMAYMGISILLNYGDQLTTNWSAKGTWGVPFLTSIVALVGIVMTSSINNSDLTRYLKKGKGKVWAGHLLGIPISKFFLVSLGILAGAANGVWDPVQALVDVAPNTWSAILILVFITMAQVTTNLTMNILPPALMIMDIFKKINWTTAVIIISVLSVATCPWILFTNDGFFMIINIPASFLGPILCVMLADYYIIRKQNLAVDQLYDDSKNVLYKFTGGWNIAALLAVVCGGIVGLIFTAFSWLAAMPVALVVYLVLYNVMYGKTPKYIEEEA